MYLYYYQKITTIIVNHKNDNSNSNERKWSYCLKEILHVVCKFYIICMDIQRVPNSLFLIWRSLSDCFNSTGTKSLILGPKNGNDSVPQYTECTWRFSKVPFLRRLYEFVLDTNVSLRISGDKPRWILNISVAKTCKFL